MDKFLLFLNRKMKFLDDWISLIVFEGDKKYSEFDISLKQRVLLTEIIHHYQEFVKREKEIGDGVE